MFMRYTPFGVGHPVIIQSMTRDCFGLQAPADINDVVDNDSDHEELSDNEGPGEFNDEDEEDEEDDLAFSDEEPEDELEDGASDSDEFDDLSF